MRWSWEGAGQIWMDLWCGFWCIDWRQHVNENGWWKWMMKMDVYSPWSCHLQGFFMGGCTSKLPADAAWRTGLHSLSMREIPSKTTVFSKKSRGKPVVIHCYQPYPHDVWVNLFIFVRAYVHRKFTDYIRPVIKHGNGTSPILVWWLSHHTRVFTFPSLISEEWNRLPH